MRLQSILSEAWRNTISGASGASLAGIAFAMLVGGVAVAETMTVRSLNERALSYQQAGGSITVVTAEDEINAASCEALAEVVGVRSAASLAVSDQGTTFSALPSNVYSGILVSSSFFELLDGIESPRNQGIWISAQTAETLALDVGDEVATVEGGLAIVGGVFSHPDDGRSDRLAQAVMVPASDDQRFDECWVDAWPDVSIGGELGRLAIRADADANTVVTVTKWNPTLQQTYSGSEIFESRITRLAPVVALALGSALGFAAVFSRRRTLASARHHGVGITAQTLQTVLEILLWVLPAAVVSFAVVAVAAGLIEAHSIAALGARAIFTGITGSVFGGILGLCLVRESLLFRYVKN